jgi:hypothetical protein
MFWFFLGLALGYGMGLNHKISNVSTDLENCNVDRDKQEADIAYYKKLTCNLVDENKELRKKINAT